MSGFKAITVNTSPEVEPHIYAEDDAAIFQTIFGKDGVSTIGQQCAATVISNNKVRVADGVICVGGHFGRIPYGEYVDCEIANGKTGVNRNDIIVAKFVTTGTGGIDTFTCEVIQGTAGSTASDPAITKNELYSGGTVREFPLYRVKLEGLSIVSVDKLFNIIPTNAELLEKVSKLNSELSTQTFSATPGIYNTISNARCAEKQKRVLISFEILMNTGSYDYNQYVCANIPSQYAPKINAPVLAYGTKNTDNSRYIAVLYPGGELGIVIGKNITSENNTIMIMTQYDID